MRIADYHKFVRSTDQYATKSSALRSEIAMYGLVGEIGSVVAAVKKQLLAEDGVEKWNHANAEIIEELGDVLWYCFSLVQISSGKDTNVFAQNIATLAKEIGANDDRARKISKALAALDKSKRGKFLRAARAFAAKKDMSFDDYQRVAFLTARTNKKTLLEVCLSVLWQLGAELMRLKLPPVERELNKSITDRSPNIVIGEIVWHLAAIASVYDRSLDKIILANVQKVSFRRPQKDPTPLHDGGVVPKPQRLPRRFDVSFITVGEGRSRMYFNGKQLGDDLTDNAYHDDGYRFHDVMHLANAAILGWSPVLRGLLGRKRKFDPKLDEVEDGARAKIVEEAVIKIIHSEGEALAQSSGQNDRPFRLFPTSGDVPFSLVKLLHRLVLGLEVRRNKYWEWERSIVAGYRVFYELCREGQGTVTVDLDARTLEFRPEVYIDVNGTVSGIGVASASLGRVTSSEAAKFLTASELKQAANKSGAQASYEVSRTIVTKKAILEAIGMTSPDNKLFRDLSIKLLDGSRVATKAVGQVRSEIWRRKIIGFKAAVTKSGSGVACTALAISDASVA